MSIYKFWAETPPKRLNWMNFHLAPSVRFRHFAGVGGDYDF